MKQVVLSVLGGLAALFVFTSLILILFFWNSASQLERVLIIMFGFSSILTEITVMYTLAQAHWSRESDPIVRIERLGNVENQYRRIIVIYILSFLVMLAVIVWYLLKGNP